MKIIKDNIWNYRSKGYIVITTNGFVKDDGECAMGGGITVQVKRKFNGFFYKLGQQILNNGNNVFCWDFEKLITFPVKHNWWEKADLELIKKSAIQLAEIIKEKKIKVYMPKPGCLNGQLKWLEVYPIIEKYLSDITIVDLN